MKYCNCTSTSPDTSSKNILLVGNSRHSGYDMYIDVTCLSCGKKHEKYNRDEYGAESINIINIKFPLDILMFEYSYVRRLLERKGETVSTKTLRNIMQAIYFAYNGDYYEHFDKYLFEDVRDAIIYYVLNKTFQDKFWSLREYDSKNLKNYISAIKRTLSKQSDRTFYLEDYLSSGEYIVNSEGSRIKYGPASIGLEYVSSYKVVASLNRSYLDLKNYKRIEKQIKYIIKTNIQSIYRKIMNYIMANYKGDFISVWNNIANSGKDSRVCLQEFIKSEISSPENKVFLTGIEQVFQKTLNYSIPEITYLNYQEIISKIKEMQEYVLTYAI